MVRLVEGAAERLRPAELARMELRKPVTQWVLVFQTLEQ